MKHLAKIQTEFVKISFNLESEANKLYQEFVKEKYIYDEMQKKYSKYNNEQSNEATEFLFNKFCSWLENVDKNYSETGKFFNYKDEVAHRVKTKLREGII